MFKFLNSTPARLVTVFLMVQTALLYSSIRTEIIPSGRPLSQLPTSFGRWNMIQESMIDKDTEEILKADDTVNRIYQDPSTGANPGLFVAAFRSQRNGKSPHSPKNCLPGSGWTQLSSEDYTFDVGPSTPITVNRYVVTHGEERDMVLYWYQSRDRVVAQEFKAKFWVLSDAIRLNRTDTALVRVIVPIVKGDEEAATRIGTDFVRSFFDTLRQYLPA